MFRTENLQSFLSRGRSIYCKSRIFKIKLENFSDICFVVNN